MATNINFIHGITVIPADWLNFVNNYVNGGAPEVGTVTNVSAVNTNGFNFAITGASSTPQITLSTSITGLLKGAAGALAAAANSDLPAMSATVGGAVPTPPNDAAKVLLGNGTWGTVPGGGAVSSVSVATANGFAGTVTNPTTTPAITLTTSLTGLLKGNGTAMSVAVAGSDYSAGTAALATGILKSTTATGALSIAVAGDFPTLNQNTSGTAAGLSATLAVASGGTGVTTSTGTGSNVLSTSPALVTPTADGFAVGYKEVPQNSKSTAYTTVAADNGKHVFHPSADTTPRTWTIDSNANVPYPVGTCLTFINGHGAGTVTIAITSDTLRLAGTGSTGSRTLSADGIATALKIATTEWLINGTGLT